LRIIGSPLSPYVRKVLVFLDLKGIPYELDPIASRAAPLSARRRGPRARAGSKNSPIRAWATSSSGGSSTRS
jgi:glutathione S-transferase